MLVDRRLDEVEKGPVNKREVDWPAKDVQQGEVDPFQSLLQRRQFWVRCRVVIVLVVALTSLGLDIAVAGPIGGST